MVSFYNIDDFTEERIFMMQVCFCLFYVFAVLGERSVAGEGFPISISVFFMILQHIFFVFSTLFLSCFFCSLRGFSTVSAVTKVISKLLMSESKNLLQISLLYDRYFFFAIEVPSKISVTILQEMSGLFEMMASYEKDLEAKRCSCVFVGVGYFGFGLSS